MSGKKTFPTGIGLPHEEDFSPTYIQIQFVEGHLLCHLEKKAGFEI